MNLSALRWGVLYFSSALAFYSPNIVAAPIFNTSVTLSYYTIDSSGSKLTIYPPTTAIITDLIEGSIGDPTLILTTADISASQIKLHLKNSITGITGRQDTATYWLIDFSPGAGIAGLFEVSDTFKGGEEIDSVTATRVVLRTNPYGPTSTPYEFAATYDISFLDSQPVPEPSALALLGIGVLGIGAIRRKFA